MSKLHTVNGMSLIVSHGLHLCLLSSFFSIIKYSLSLCSFSQVSKIKTLYEALSEFDRRPLKYEARAPTSGRSTGRFGRSKSYTGLDAVKR